MRSRDVLVKEFLLASEFWTTGSSRISSQRTVRTVTFERHPGMSWSCHFQVSVQCPQSAEVQGDQGAESRDITRPFMSLGEVLRITNSYTAATYLKGTFMARKRRWLLLTTSSLEYIASND